MDLSVTALAYGFVLGLRHALDPDHLVAVTTIVSEHRSLRRSSLVGTVWGLGHTVALVASGTLVILLRISIPKDVEILLETGVGGMLIILGALVLLRLARSRGLQVHAHTHSHEGEPSHSHLHLHNKDDHDHRHFLFKLGRKPFLVGMVHGLAGSSGLILLALSTVPSAALGVAYIAIAGVGSIGGMLLMSGLISLPFMMTSHRYRRINLAVKVAAGLFSILFGAVLTWEKLGELAG